MSCYSPSCIWNDSVRTQAFRAALGDGADRAQGQAKDARCMFGCLRGSPGNQLRAWAAESPSSPGSPCPLATRLWTNKTLPPEGRDAAGLGSPYGAAPHHSLG